MTQRRHRVLIVGGGYGGLYTAMALRDAPVDVTLVDRRNHHLFTPLLYQVATGALAPSEIAQPLRLLLRRQANTRVLLGEAAGLDPVAREVHLTDGTALPYDTLVVASGTTHSYFGHAEWARHAPGIKSLEDALDMRARILHAFEAAEMETDSVRQHAWMTFVIVGGGPTGVELAGALCEIARDALPRDFRAINTEEAQVFLVEAADRILPTYPRSLSRAAARQLAQLGATIRTRTRVTAIDAEGVAVEDSRGGQPERIEARTVLWAAGVAVDRFGQAVAGATGAPTDRVGRIHVGSDLDIPGHPGIFVVGDLAQVAAGGGRTVPGVAQGGIQEGKHVARTIVARVSGEPTSDFRFRDLGELATIGRLRAVADFRRVRFSGVIDWFLWLGIHIFWLIGLQNRILVMVRWAWSFLTRGRGNRLITGLPASLDERRPEG
ncbi:NAD(P)/FAD-dependent oxidoreductase [soil metagenome]